MVKANPRLDRNVLSETQSGTTEVGNQCLTESQVNVLAGAPSVKRYPDLQVAMH